MYEYENGHNYKTDVIELWCYITAWDKLAELSYSTIDALLLKLNTEHPLGRPLNVKFGNITKKMEDADIIILDILGEK